MIDNKYDTHDNFDSKSIVKNSYLLVMPTKCNFFSFVGLSGEKKFPLYYPIFPRLIISDGSHFYIDDSVIE